MAKQTFTVGQVLTADQMTSLQQTALGGGSATAKTASYTLVAADAGTTVIMNSASSTTITVNTSLFAAGDTVLIINQGAGVCTVTAGTATVSTAGSLALSQYETGILYFLSASAAIFNDYTQAASSSGMTLINTGGTSFTGTSVTISSIPSTYNDLRIYIVNADPSVDADSLRIRFNGDSTANRHATATDVDVSAGVFNQTASSFAFGIDNGTSIGLIAMTIPYYANTTTWKMASVTSMVNDSANAANYGLYDRNALYNQTAAISSLEFLFNGGVSSGGTIYVYGVK